MKTVILAGGAGTRIAEEGGRNIPKPLQEIGGYPILWHIMKYYSHHGYNDFVICCGHLGYMIKEYFADYSLHRSDITFDYSGSDSGDVKMSIHSNVTEPWKVTLVHTGRNSGTGGRVLRIRDYVEGERFFLTYGDGVSNVDLSSLLSHHEQSNATITITAIQPEGRFGLIDFDGDFNVRGFREKSREDSGWINAGFMVAQPGVFDYINGDTCTLEEEPFDCLSSAGKMAAYRHYGYWQCMDTQRDRGFLEKRWAEGNAPWKVWE